MKEGVSVYRKLRNQLTHEDGATLDRKPGQEIQILPEHLENFYKLFTWCSKQVKTKG